ncbi:unnamed protein product, partial [Penicillium discolor]
GRPSAADRDDRLRDQCGEALGSVRREGGAPEGEPHGRLGDLRGDAAGEQHGGGLVAAGRAGGAAGRDHPAALQLQQHRLAAHTRDREARRRGEPMHGMPGQRRVGHPPGHLADEARRRLCRSGRSGRALVLRELERRRQADCSGDVHRAGPPSALLAPTVQERLQREASADDERPGPFGSAELVPGDRHGVGIQIVQGQPAGRLHGVDVEGHAAGADDLAERGDVLDGADLVVRVSDGHDGRVVGEHRVEGVRPDPPGPVHRGHRYRGPVEPREVRCRLPDRLVLDGRHHDAPPPGGERCQRDPLHGEVVRLRAAAGEDDVAYPRPEDAGDPGAGVLQRPRRRLARGVVAGRVAEHRGEVGLHGRAHLGAYRRGRGVIERPRGVREGSDRDHIHPGLGDGADGGQVDAARGLHGGALADEGHPGAQVVEGEVVQQHRVGTAVEHRRDLVETVDLDDDVGGVRQPRERLAKSRREVEPGPLEHCEVVVLRHDRVGEGVPVVPAAAGHHGVPLERPQSRRGLAGVGDARPRSLDFADVGGGEGRDARHPLHEVQGDALGGEDRAGRPGHGGQHVGGGEGIAVAHVQVDRDVGIGEEERGGEGLAAAEDPVLAGDEVRRGRRLRREQGGAGWRG